MYLFKKNTERVRVNNSANGTTNHNPFKFKICGNIANPIITNINDLENAMIEDSFPFENAVNILEVQTFIPTNKKHKENNLNPENAI